MATTGIVGLSPTGDQRGDLFVEKFFKAGIIDQAVFSLYIELQNETSQIAFGGYDIEQFGLYGKNTPVHFHRMSPINAQHWQLDLSTITVLMKTPDKDQKYNEISTIFDSNQKVIIDSGTSFILMP